MIDPEGVLTEFVQNAHIGREHKISPMLYLYSRGRTTRATKPKKIVCVNCRRSKCYCAKFPSRKHRRDYKLFPRRKSHVQEIA